MSTDASVIVRAAIDAAKAELKKQGLEREIPHLSRLFLKELGHEASTVSAVLITPSGNAGPLRDSLAKTLEKSLGRPVELEEKADPSIIGGAVLQIGDERIDLSIKGSLQKIATQIQSSR